MCQFPRATSLLKVTDLRRISDDRRDATLDEQPGAPRGAVRLIGSKLAFKTPVTAGETDPSQILFANTYLPLHQLFLLQKCNAIQVPVR